MVGTAVEFETIFLITFLFIYFFYLSTNYIRAGRSTSIIMIFRSISYDHDTFADPPRLAGSCGSRNEMVRCLFFFFRTFENIIVSRNIVTAKREQGWFGSLD